MGKNTHLQLPAYQKIILPLLQESFSERESANLFKLVLEEFFQRRFLDLQRFELGDEELEELTAVFQKLADQYPWQYIFHRADFYGLTFYVDESVLIPRPETEELVHWILQEHADGPQNVLDIGTGSGCIPITLKKHRPNWQVSAIDISPEALTVARKNATQLKTPVDFIEADILNPTVNIQHSTFNIIVSNPPYIPYRESDRMSGSTLHHEPRLALFVPDTQPLLFYERLVALSRSSLVPGGRLYVELNEFNAADVVNLFTEAGFQQVELKKDMAGKDRMLRAVQP